MSFIEVKGLKFRYPLRTNETLNIPSFEVREKEKIFLFGPSGSGKTTFLEILAGVLVPQSGDVFLRGENIAAMSEKQRDAFRGRNIGFIFQNFNLIPYLNVRENIELGRHLQGRESDSVLLKKLTAKLGLTSFLEQSVSTLSTGQGQRVAAARAFYLQPSLILADEPTSSLDYDHRERFIQLLFSLSQDLGTTVIFVSHDRSLEKLFDRSVALMDLNQVSPVDDRDLEVEV